MFGDAIAAEMNSLGLHVFEAPGLNLARLPVLGRNFEYFGEDPYLTGVMGVAEIQAIQDDGLIAMAKHFVANEQETNRMGIQEIVDKRTLHELCLLPYWPTAHNRHTFEASLYFVPPKNASEGLRQEMSVVSTKEYALQDANTLEATQSMIEARNVTTFVLNDQEVLCRHHHAAVHEHVRAYDESTPVDYPWMRHTVATGT